MKVPLFILGFLLKNGPSHGYRLKQDITDETSYFTEIKQPTIYYHLEKLLKKGFIISKREQEGNRPERDVYQITKTGIDYFAGLLDKAIKETYSSDFLIDPVLYFVDYYPVDQIIESLTKQVQILDTAIGELLLKNTEIELEKDGDEAMVARAIFNHKLYHYQVEIKWLRETIDQLNKIKEK
jgi:DNA-binding PadR family transcriptional regulator